MLKASCNGSFSVQTKSEVKRVFDFRGAPLQSPVVWCIHCHALVKNEPVVQVMQTVYHGVLGFGIVPCGLCETHKESGTTLSG